jgi:hypothetical protein
MSDERKLIFIASLTRWCVLLVVDHVAEDRKT